jgi:hypothetical protein
MASHGTGMITWCHYYGIITVSHGISLAGITWSHGITGIITASLRRHYGAYTVSHGGHMVSNLV